MNETEPLSGNESDFSGIWYPTFTYKLSNLFANAEKYVMSFNLSSTTLTVDISETPYYVKNVQSPIARRPEIIFRTILFIIVCLELCGLIFVLCKLLFIPFYHKLYASCSGHRANKVRVEHELETTNH